MKVLIAHNFYQQGGGEDHVMAAEMALLEAHGHIVIPYRLHNDAINGMGRARLAVRTLWSRASYRDIKEQIRRHRPQVAHFHNTFPLISPAAYYAARSENVSVVQTLHNFRIFCPNALLFRDGGVCEDCLGKSFAWPGIVHKCYRGSRVASAAVATMAWTHRVLGTWRELVDRYIALTQFSRRKIIDGGLPAHKVVVKPNFVYPDPGPGNHGHEYIVFVGRFSPEKGLETLLKAWRMLGGRVRLKLLGDGPQAPLIRDAAARERGIEWLGSRPLEDVYTALGRAHCLVLPSQCYEGFPRVVVEAFAKGTPVVASNLGAMAEVVTHGRTGLHFRPGDPADLAAQIQRLLDAPEQAQRMRLAARREYELRYTAESNYRILMDIYQSALERAGHPAAPVGTGQDVRPHRESSPLECPS
jgi:glycosyltransferase involved in cell wall biosynthesis